VTDPETLAGRRWKQLAPILENRDRVLGLHAEATARAAWLRERLPAMEHEAREAWARAIVAEKPLPKSDERERLADELAALREYGAALDVAVDIVSRELYELRRENQDKWRQEQARTVAQAQRVVHEEGGRKNRQTLAEEQALLAWVDEPLPDVYVGLAEANQQAAVAHQRRAMQPLRALALATDNLARRVRVNELTGGGPYWLTSLARSCRSSNCRAAHCRSGCRPRASHEPERQAHIRTTPAAPAGDQHRGEARLHRAQHHAGRCSGRQQKR
jgi:hypothetical protein